jgi:deoxyribonuclease V
MLHSLYPFEHLWALTQFKAEQETITRVAGADVSYRENYYSSALVILEKNKTTYIKTGGGITSAPYRPSLFFLKEGPIISDLIFGEPLDLLFINGHGICHPHGYGLATVVGMTHGIPTIGFARELIKGEYDETLSSSPDISYIAQHGIIKAAAIRTSKSKKPVYISQGFGISLKRTIEEYHRWAIRGKVPEPLRLAHIHAKKSGMKRELRE